MSDTKKTEPQIVSVGVDKLVPYKKNTRRHDERQIEQIIASITEFGFTNPLLIDGKNEIIAGHGRYFAAVKMGMSTVPCIVLKHLSKKQCRAYAIADNKLTLNATWEEDLLMEELNALRDEDYDLSLTGFEDDELERILNGGGWNPDFDNGGGDDTDDAGDGFVMVHVKCKSEDLETVRGAVIAAVKDIKDVTIA